MGVSVFVIGCLDGSALTHSLESAYYFKFILLHKAAYCSLKASWSSLQKSCKYLHHATLGQQLACDPVVWNNT